MRTGSEIGNGNHVLLRQREWNLEIILEERLDLWPNFSCVPGNERKRCFIQK